MTIILSAEVKKLNNTIKTIFFVPDMKHLYLSSSLVSKVVELGGNAKDLIPECVLNALLKKYQKWSGKKEKALKAGNMIGLRLFQKILK